MDSLTRASDGRCHHYWRVILALGGAVRLMGDGKIPVDFETGKLYSNYR
jgi:hypothetical protein